MSEQHPDRVDVVADRRLTGSATVMGEQHGDDVEHLQRQAEAIARHIELHQNTDAHYPGEMADLLMARTSIETLLALHRLYAAIATDAPDDDDRS